MEQLMFFGGLLSMVIALGAAYAAKRSANAAEIQAKAAQEQARHAQTQADAATLQSRAAGAQVTIMQSSLTVDQVVAGITARRHVSAVRQTLKDVRIDQLRSAGGNHIHAVAMKLRAEADAVEDIPPVFPAQVRQLAYRYLLQVREIEALMLRNSAEQEAFDASDIEADRLLAAMNVALNNRIDSLKD